MLIVLRAPGTMLMTFSSFLPPFPTRLFSADPQTTLVRALVARTKRSDASTDTSLSLSRLSLPGFSELLARVWQA